MKQGKPALYGVMAQFDNPTDLVAAARETYAAGYRSINGYSPFPIEELSDAIGFRRTLLPLIVLVGGIIGALAGFFMQYWMEVIDYPIIVGGKPFNSWPAFIPITFECTVLAAAFAAVLGMLALNKLPQPYHPVFNAPNFALATRDSSRSKAPSSLRFAGALQINRSTAHRSLLTAYWLQKRHAEPAQIERLSREPLLQRRNFLAAVGRRHSAARFLARGSRTLFGKEIDRE